MYLIDKFYPLLVDVIKEATKITIPTCKLSEKRHHWWSEELNDLKNSAIQSFQIWKDAGKPRSGPVFNIYKGDKYAYKIAINNHRQENELTITNELHDALCEKNKNNFWKIWKSKFQSTKTKKPLIVSGFSDAKDIADAFSQYFGNICTPNSSVYNERSRSEFDHKINSYIGDILMRDDLFSVETICKIICELKPGKACGLDGLMAEHLLHCHPAVHLIITYLCNLMLMSGHVPSQFTLGLTFPIEKVTVYNRASNVDDYRGITISPLLSKILEKCVLDKFGEYFKSSVNQFGFKKNIGCQHAIYVLRSTVDYFVNKHSTVNICSLDVAKAFDRINHYRLYIKLMERLVPVNIVMLLFNTYKLSSAVVNWNGCISLPYQIFAGVRQGESISPVIFAVYVNSVIETLRLNDLGCFIGQDFFGVIMYADDLLLVSSSVTNLQKMVEICLSEFMSLDLTINAKKSVCV